jgi:hypothetical protein
MADDESALYVGYASTTDGKEPPARSSYSALVRRRTSQLLGDLLRLQGFREQNERLKAKITGAIACAGSVLGCTFVCVVCLR